MVSGYIMGMNIYQKKKRHYFGFRFESRLDKRILHQCTKDSTSLNRLVREAVLFTGKLHDKRKLKLSRSFSAFRSRISMKDRVTTVLILDISTREMIRNFSICYRKSMAEFIRIALELYLDWQEKGQSKMETIKHYYNKPQKIIKRSIIVIFPSFPLKNPPYI